MGPNTDDFNNTINSITFRAIQGSVTALVVLFPLSLIKDMSGFRYISFASIIALIYTGIVMLVELPAYISMTSDNT